MSVDFFVTFSMIFEDTYEQFEGGNAVVPLPSLVEDVTVAEGLSSRRTEYTVICNSNTHLQTINRYYVNWSCSIRCVFLLIDEGEDVRVRGEGEG